MKLIKEYTIKVLIIIFILVFALEISISLLIYKNSNNIYKKLFDNTLEKSAQKAKESMESLHQFISNLLMNYVSKLKIILKHFLQYNEKPKFFENFKSNYKIINANTDKILEKNVFNDIYNETTGKFEYIDYYIKKYEKENDRNILLKKLLKEHDELNYIGYYNYINSELGLDNLEEEDIKKINYIVTILKTIFIERFVTKKEKMDIIEIFILTENSLIIYPPEDPYKIHFYNNIDDNYYFCSDEIPEEYYFCMYLYMQIFFENFLNIIREYYDFNNHINSICTKFSFFTKNSYDSFLCIEVNFRYYINNNDFLETKKSDFGLMASLLVDVESPKYPIDLFVIYNTNRKINEIIEVFNSSEYTPDVFVLKDDKTKHYSLYYVLYLETTKILKKHPELKVNISEIEKEYEDFRIDFFNTLFESEGSTEFQVNFKKTICRKKLISNEYECIKTEFKMSMIMPYSITINVINEDIVDINNTEKIEFNLIIYSITNTFPEINDKNIGLLIRIKLLRIIFLDLVFIIIIFFNYIFFINIISRYFLNSINDITIIMDKITINEETQKIKLEKYNKNFHENNEMLILNNIYELFNNSLIIKEIVENEAFLKKYKFELNLDNIKNKNIKEICNYIYGIHHFKNNMYIQAEDEIKSTIIFIKQIEKKLNIEGKNEYDKIKENIKRSSLVPYLNEYSEFENIDENIKNIINLDIYKQRINYIYAMIKYKLSNEINNDKNDNVSNINKIKIKKYKEKQYKYLNEAIKYFEECKNINVSLGINQIKIIYCLIMISKCYLILKDYKNSIININDALNLFFKLSKSFNDSHSNKYNPKVMLFVETNIFQYILLNISNICSNFRKPYASNWIILKIFNTSPFILNNIHYTAGINLLNFLDKNKINMKKYNKNYIENEYLIKENIKIKKYYSKYISRLYSKVLNDKNIKDINIKYPEGYNKKSIKSISIKQKNTLSKLSSYLNNNSKYKDSIYINKNRQLKKNITFCINENIFEKFNWEEFKSIIIKYLNKYFSMNIDDKFGYIQFSTNGLTTKYFLSQNLNQFISRLNKIKNNIESTELTDFFKKNNSQIFIGLYDIFYSIINNYQKIDLRDNIIMLFIDVKDIRFSSISDCLNTVEALNESNTSVFFFSFNETIEQKTINNIQSFLNGLIEGYFFQIKNFRQLKEIFVNLSTKNIQTNHFKYNYNFFDQSL